MVKLKISEPVRCKQCGEPNPTFALGGHLYCEFCARDLVEFIPLGEGRFKFMAVKGKSHRTVAVKNFPSHHDASLFRQWLQAQSKNQIEMKRTGEVPIKYRYGY